MKNLKVTSKKVARIDNQYSNMAKWRENALAAYNAKLEMKKGVIHVTTPDEKHKLDGFDGINTSVCNNPHCIMRRKEAIENGRLDCICIRCYADSLLGCYKDVEINGRYNQQILTSKLLSEDEIKSIRLHYGNYGRFEMFGDSTNILQAENYINIARTWNKNNFGVWSKNGRIHYKPVFEKIGKPENLTFVKSSVYLDKVDDVSPEEWYVDTVFTVCKDEETYNRLIQEYNGVACAGIHCKTCLHCYNYKRNENGGKVQYVFELLR